MARSFLTKRFLTLIVGGILFQTILLFSQPELDRRKFAELQYHPYRKVGGLYYDLNPLYTWIRSWEAARDKRSLSPRSRPMQEWIGAVQFDGTSTTKYIVDEVWDNGLLVHRRDFTSISTDRDPFFLANFPGFQNLVDGQEIRFLALQNGNFSYDDTNGGKHTVPFYDYGIPYDPRALLAAKKAASTNAPPVKPQTNSPGK